MKILHIVSNISKQNGIMHFIMSYYSKLKDCGVTFDFVYFDERKDNFEDSISSFGGKCFCFPKPKNLFKLRKRIVSFSKENHGNYDIMHIHDTFMISFFYSLKKKCGIKKIVCHAHSTRFSDNFLGGIRNRILSFPNKFLTDYFAACSDDAGISLFGKHYKKRGFLIKNALNIENYKFDENERRFIRTKYGFDNKTVIGHIGNFSTPKNHTFLVDVFSHYHALNSNSVLVLVGDGPLRNSIESKIRELNLESSAYLIGRNNNAKGFLSSFDIFVFPSLFEGLGISFIEAQCNGLPCFVSDAIPSDANICCLNNEVVPLSSTAKEWAAKIFEKSSIRCDDNVNLIKKSGYDIQSAYLKLLEIYERIIEE